MLSPIRNKIGRKNALKFEFHIIKLIRSSVIFWPRISCGSCDGEIRLRTKRMPIGISSLAQFLSSVKNTTISLAFAVFLPLLFSNSLKTFNSKTQAITVHSISLFCQLTNQQANKQMTYIVVTQLSSLNSFNFYSTINL